MPEMLLKSVWDLVLDSLLFFLPAYFANAAPVLANQLKFLDFLGKPIDGGKSLWGERILGQNKTWRGVLAGLVLGFLGGIVGILWWDFFKNTHSGPDISLDYFRSGLYGAWMGIGAIFGDSVKSFIKRRLKIKPGRSWPFFDQIDFIVGAWLFSLLLSPIEWSWPKLICALIITPPIPLLANWIAYKLGWKKVWW